MFFCYLLGSKIQNNVTLCCFVVFALQWHQMWRAWKYLCSLFLHSFSFKSVLTESVISVFSTQWLLSVICCIWWMLLWRHDLHLFPRHKQRASTASLAGRRPSRKPWTGRPQSPATTAAVSHCMQEVTLAVNCFIVGEFPPHSLTISSLTDNRFRKEYERRALGGPSQPSPQQSGPLRSDICRCMACVTLEFRLGACLHIKSFTNTVCSRL